MTKRQAGFTLIEVMVGLAITSFISVILLNASITGLQNFTFVSNAQHRVSSFLEIFNRIDRHVRLAATFPTEYPELSSQPLYTANATTLIMKLHSVKSDGSRCSNNFDYVIYTLENGKLREQVKTDPVSARAATDQTLLSNVSELLFTQTVKTRREVTVKLTQQMLDGNRTVTRTNEQTMVARND
ncbi:MAG TPA: prepilin-type N-terminal cleavage/methylation domain-containing protein [Patescibacteria group bacterium]